MKITIHILTLLLVIVTSFGYGQNSYTAKAYESYKVKDLEKAQLLIDSAILSDERFDTQTWQLRGIIYRNMEGPENNGYREIALESFIQAKEMDKQDLFEEKINSYLENTIIRYYNDAVLLMNNEHNLTESEKSYKTYKTLYNKYIDQNYLFDEQDIAYYNALGSEYLIKIAQTEGNDQKVIRETAIEKLNNVIKIDSLDFSSNLNCGAIYYTLAVDYTMNLDAESTIEDIIDNQQKSEQNFLKALPYLHRAEKIQPENLDVIKALMGCYYGLNNNELYLKYQTILDKREIDSYLEKLEANPADIETLKQLVRIYSTTLIDKEKEQHFRELLRQIQN